MNMRNLTKRDVLASIATTDQGPDVGQAAVERLTDQAVLVDIGKTLAERENKELVALEASEWLQDYGTKVEQAAAMGIGPFTNDDELARIQEDIREAAQRQGVRFIEGLGPYVRKLRALQVSINASIRHKTVAEYRKDAVAKHASDVLVERLLAIDLTPYHALCAVENYLAWLGHPAAKVCYWAAARQLWSDSDRSIGCRTGRKVEPCAW